MLFFYSNISAYLATIQIPNQKSNKSLKLFKKKRKNKKKPETNNILPYIHQFHLYKSHKFSKLLHCKLDAFRPWYIFHYSFVENKPLAELGVRIIATAASLTLEDVCTMRDGR